MQEEIAIGEYEIKIINNKQIKTQPNSTTSIVYVNIVKELKSRDTEFYTYKPKQERSFKVVLLPFTLGSAIATYVDDTVVLVAYNNHIEHSCKISLTLIVT